MKITSAQKNLIKHYVYAVIVAGVSIYQTGNHNISKVAWAALVAVLAPVAETVWVKIKSQAAKPIAPAAPTKPAA